MRHSRRIARFICCAALATACGAPSAAPTTTPAASISPRATASESPAPTAQSAWPATTPDVWLLVGRAGATGIEVIQASTSESVLALPDGVAARPDWLHMIAAAPAGSTGTDRTVVRDVLVQPGLGGPELAIDGAWRLPTIGYDPLPVGLSADGSTAVLVEATPAAEGPDAVSRFAVLSITPFGGPPRIVELRGLFEYDAISSDGRILYVVEHLSGEGSPYQVRAIDLPAGTMRPGIIADKRNLGEEMAGWPIAQLRAPSGMAFTLYNGLEHPFIHALDTTDAWAVCIDLPAMRAEEQPAARHWGLAASPDWTTVYAANAAIGRVSVVDVSELDVKRSVALGPIGSVDSPAAARGPLVDLAKFGHIEGGPIGRRIVAAPDGATVYVAGPAGILAIRTKDLSVAARLVKGSAVDALGMTPDGRAIFALLHNRGRIVALDPATGDVLGEVRDEGFDRLLAVVPW